VVASRQKVNLQAGLKNVHPLTSEMELHRVETGLKIAGFAVRDPKF
jgi:hypothetical protein